MADEQSGQSAEQPVAEQSTAEEPAAEQPAQQPTAAQDDAARFLTLAQAADYLDISRRRLNTLRRQGKILAQRVGWNGLGGWRFRVADLMAYVASAADGTSQKSSEAAYGDAVKAMADMGPPPKDETPDTVRAESDEAPIVRMANAVLVSGIEKGASDIHLEPDRTNLRVRLRIDGALMQLMTLPKYIQRPLLDRFKVMADVSLYERASPHQGSIPVKHGEQDYNFRVSVVPSYYGESVILHVLRSHEIPILEQLGLAPEMQEELDRMAFHTRGLLMIAGPSRAGRTTTASAILYRLNSVTRQIVTYEDAPERMMAGMVQTYRSRSKDFAPHEAIAALRRHDPDILFLGDIDSSAMAKAAIDAAKTGILVVATIVARDSVDALAQMASWGTTPSDLSRTLTGIVAQYLVAKVCPDCGGEGCDACRQKGRKGRIGVFELRNMDEQNTREALAGKMPLTELRGMPMSGLWRQQGLMGDARAKAEQGIIPTEEVNRLYWILPK